LISRSLVDRPIINADFIGNPDPDGRDRTVSHLDLKDTPVIITSKSGSMPEPRNAMLKVMKKFETAGISFQKQAVAITSQESKLHNQSTGEGCITIIPMFYWIGGGMNITSSLGRPLGAFIGVEIAEF
jgi:glucose-6-phosphate isomerase